MIGTDLIPGERPAAPEPKAPPLPIEAPAVRAALAAVEARDKINLIMALLSYAARNDADVETAFGQAQTYLSNACVAYSEYRAIRECKGSA